MTMQRNTLIGIVVVVLVLGVGYLLATQSQRQQTTTVPTPTQTQTVQPTVETDQEEDTNDAMEKEVTTIEISGKNFEFSKSEIRVKKGDTVKIVFSSTGGLHDWVVDEFNAKTDQVNTGSTAEVEFVADKAGTFEYYCSVGNHRAMGMVGNLIVE